MVAISSFGVTVRTFAGDISVGEELVGFFVIKLHGCFLDELAVVVKMTEKFGGSVRVDVRSGAGIDVERDTQFLERVFDDRVVTIHDVLRSNALSFSFYSDWNTMLVATTDHDDVATLQAQVTGVNVGGNVNSGEVTDVDGAVGVWESCSYESAFEILHVAVMTD